MEGKELKKIRGEMNLTQEELARELSVASNTVARWERGERKIPNHLSLALEMLKTKQKAQDKQN